MCLLAAAAAVALAQTPDPSANSPDTMPNRGFYPAGSFSISDIEAVNNVTGNVTLAIPVAKLPPGRGALFVVSQVVRFYSQVICPF
ncbi:MAG: hypothetical protein ABI165_04550 [Bryobacteraceae bacterium]